jgi:hypothetical protein
LATLHVLVAFSADLAFEVVVILSLPDQKSLLVRLVGDAVPDERPKHHLVTAHEVVHGGLNLCFKSFLIENNEVDFGMRHDLDPYVASDVKDISSHVLKLVVHFPLSIL